MPMTAFDRALGLRALALHQFVYEISGGRIGKRIGKAQMLLLRTSGRKTGLPRTAALLYHRDGGSYVGVGSNGGSDLPPAWRLNLEAAPERVVRVATKRFPARRRAASAANPLRPRP